MILHFAFWIILIPSAVIEMKGLDINIVIYGYTEIFFSSMTNIRVIIMLQEKYFIMDVLQDNNTFRIFKDE